MRLYLDGCDGEGDLPPTIDVRVQNTKNVLELLRDDQRLKTHNTHTHMLSGRLESVSTAMSHAFRRAVHANTLQTYNTIISLFVYLTWVCSCSDVAEGQLLKLWLHTELSEHLQLTFLAPVSC